METPEPVEPSEEIKPHRTQIDRFQDLRAKQKQERDDFRQTQDDLLPPRRKEDGIEILTQQKREEFRPPRNEPDLQPKRNREPDSLRQWHNEPDLRRKRDNEPELRPQRRNEQDLQLRGKQQQGDDRSILSELRIQTDLLKQIADKEGLS